MDNFHVTILLSFLGQSVCVVLFIAVSKSFESTSQRGTIIDEIGVQLKRRANALFMFNISYSHNLIMKFSHVNNIGNTCNNL